MHHKASQPVQILQPSNYPTQKTLHRSYLSNKIDYLFNLNNDTEAAQSATNHDSPHKPSGVHP